jgi:SAM-dependent methyltransferase
MTMPSDHLRERFATIVERDFNAYISPDQPHHNAQLAFALGRFDVGVALCSHLRTTLPARPRVLDIGSGNGGVSLAFAGIANARAFTVDIAPNAELRALQDIVTLRSVVGDGARLPFESDSFDIVLLLDTIEHVAKPHLVASEAMRVLRRGGVCIVTTPARVHYLLRRDPHFGVPGLVWLPNGMQRFIVDRVLRRRPAYDVTHIYWTANEVLRLFPNATRSEVLFNREYRPPGRFTIECIRHPRHILEQLRYEVRRFFFAGMMVWK